MYRWLPVLCFLLLPLSTYATVRNVGSGQTYATIQAGVNAAVEGDEVRIHSGTYNECVVVDGSSGTAQVPIVVTAASGHSPVLTATCSSGGDTGMFRINNVDHWHIDGTLNGGTLTWDGNAGNNPLWAIYVSAQANDTFGIEIRNVTIRDWAGDWLGNGSGNGSGAILFRGNAGSENWDAKVTGATISGCAMGISAFSAPRILIEYNTIHDMVCGDHDNNEVSSWPIKYGRAGEPGNAASPVTIRYNNFYNIPVCTLNSACIYCDVGKPGGTIEYNYCHDSAEGNSNNAFKGIFVEANCGDTTIRYNVVANVAGIGLQSRDPAGTPGTTPESRYYRNTVFDAAGMSFYMRDGNADGNNCSGGICTLWRGNLFMQTRATADFVEILRPTASLDSQGNTVPASATLTEWDAEENWYYNNAGNATPFRFEWNTTTPNEDYTFAQWQSNCGGCDDTSTNGTDPQFVATTGTTAGDFLNLNTGSPAIDGCGTNAAMGPYLGSAHDCGAFEAPLFDSAQTTDSATTVQVTFETIHGALTECTLSRFDIDASVTGNNLVPTAYSISGNQVTLTTPTLRATDTITISGQRNACRSVFIPSTPMAVATAAFTNQPVDNNIGDDGEDEGTWVSGVNHVAPAGSDRLMMLGFCWSPQTTNPAVSITSPTYGGQACTIIDTEVMVEATAQTLAMLAYCDEADIAAASSSVIAYTTSEAPSGTRPVIVGSAFYTGINQSTPMTDSDTAQTAGTSISTAALTTSNPGSAVAVACANGNNLTWTPGSGWTEQLDVCEDAACSKRMLAEDRATTGADVTPSGTLSGTSARIAMVAAALNGGDEGPPGDPFTLTQVAYRGHEWRVLSTNASPYWLGPENAPILVSPDGKLSLVLSYQVTTNGEPTATGKTLLCSDNGGTLYIPSSSHGSNKVAFITSPAWADQTVISSRLLSVPAGGDTFVAGVRHSTQTPVATRLPTANDYSEREFSLHVVGTAVGDTDTVTCQLGLTDGTPLACEAPECPATITVVRGRAHGF